MNIFSISLCATIIMASMFFSRGEIHADANFLALTNASYFVDMSVMIHKIFQFLECYRCQVITCPHGFGKSTNIDMIKRFVQIEVDESGNAKPLNQTSHHDLFVNKLKVKCFYNDTLRFHLGYYPVIHIELKNIIAPTMQGVFANLAKAVRKTYQPYEWLYKLYSKAYAGDDNAGNPFVKAQLAYMKKIFEDGELKPDVIRQSMVMLVETLSNYFNLTTFVIIDDYDAPYIDLIKDTKNPLELSEVHNTIKSIFERLLDPDTSRRIEYTWISGTNSVPFPHDMNNTRFRRFMDSFPFAHYYSFEPAEMNELVKKFQLDDLQKTELAYYHNGYYYPHHWFHVYRPSYVVKYLTKQEINTSETNWIEHGDLTPLSAFLKNKLIREKIKELVDTRRCTFNITRLIKFEDWQKLSDILRGKGDPETFNINVFFTILYENGYLSYSERSNDYVKEKILKEFEQYNPDDDSFHEYIVNYGFKVPNILMVNSFKKFYSLYKENL